MANLKSFESGTSLNLEIQQIRFSSTTKIKKEKKKEEEVLNKGRKQVRGEVELEFQYTHIRAWSSLYEGVRQYNATQYLKAIPLLTASLATMPDCMELLSYRSQCYLKARKCDAAMADADEMIASWPNEPEGYLRKGQVGKEKCCILFFFFWFLFFHFFDLIFALLSIFFEGFFR